MCSKSIIMNSALTLIFLSLLLPVMVEARVTPFSECGIIWSDTGCFVIDVDGNHDTYYIIDSVGEINYGDWACIYGILDSYCDTSCGTVEGCVLVDSIIPQNHPDTTVYIACGILIQGTGCVLFSPVSGPIVDDDFYLFLHNYGPFGVGDTVCVSGTLLYDSVPGCLEAVGQLLDNTIDLWEPSNTPFSDCGIMTMQSGCLLFTPFSMPGTHYYLDQHEGFDNWDTVCVSGVLIPSCDSNCVAADGCIAGNTIHGWNNDGWPYEQCGVIIDGPDCIIFAPFNDSVLLAVDFIGDHVADDSVCISGVVEWNCDLGCAGVAGCIYTNNITFRTEFYHNLEVIIKLEEGFTIEPILEDFQGSILDLMILGNIYLVSFPTDYLLEDIIDILSVRPGVIFAQPNYAVGFPETFHVSQSFPDDNQPSLVWGVSPANYFSSAGSYTVNSDSANLYSSGENMVVAVIDNGADLTHPLLNQLICRTGL